MKPGRYAADDGSFGRSAGGAVGRGVALLAVALVIGIVLLNRTDAEPPGSRVSAGTGASDDGDGDGDGGRGGGAPRATTTAPTTAPPRPPAEVKVIVVNAAGVKGLAGRASDQLKPAGYNVLAPTNGTATETGVFHTEGYGPDAAAIAAFFQFPPEAVKPVAEPPPIADATGADVIVLIAADEAAKVTSSAGATTTTARAGAATTTTARTGATTTAAPTTTAR